MAKNLLAARMLRKSRLSSSHTSARNFSGSSGSSMVICQFEGFEEDVNGQVLSKLFSLFVSLITLAAARLTCLLPSMYGKSFRATAYIIVLSALPHCVIARFIQLELIRNISHSFRTYKATKRAQPFLCEIRGRKLSGCWTCLEMAMLPREKRIY